MALRTTLLVALVLTVVSAPVVAYAGVTTQAGATIEVEASQSIPEQVLRFGDRNFSVDSVYVGDPGDTVSANVTVTEPDPYRVYVYNTDEQVVAQQRAVGNGTVSFDLEGYPTGTYLLAVSQDGRFVAAHPLVVRGYTADLTVPDRVDAGESAELRASLTYLRGQSLSTVQFVVTDGEQRVQANGSVVSEQTYRATIDTSGLESGTYQVYATVRGRDTAYGGAEFLGVSEAATLEVGTTSPTPTPRPSNGGDGGGEGGGGDGGSTATPTDDPTTRTPADTATLTETAGPNGTAGATGTATATAVPTEPPTLTATTPPTTTEPTTTTESDVVTPQPTDTSTTTTSSGDGPGFGALLALVVLLVVGALIARD
jgi:PGF-CTERM protein